MPKKIFDLAKELDLKPIDLVDKLKSKGYSVRNHMSSLSDQDVEKFLVDLKQEEEDQKLTKKKTSKKKKRVAKTAKTVKKKLTKKVSAAGAEKDDAEKVVKKKTTIRRRKAKPVEAAVVATETTPEEVIACHQSTEDASVEIEKVAEVKNLQSGLRVVQQPEKVVAAKTSDKPSQPKEDSGQEAKSSDATVKRSYGDANVPPDPSDADSHKKDHGDETAKKRLGGLATMMSGRKSSVSKAQTLTQSRADSEMKSYAALSGIGRPIYTQIKKKKIYVGSTASTNLTEVKESKRVVRIHQVVKAEDLANKLSQKFSEFADRALDLNLLLKCDDYIGVDLANQLSALYEYRVEDKAFDEDKVIGKEESSQEEKNKWPIRHPIITIMGHVDHGKTTLIDHIRQAKVAESEAGGITQHVGAYLVKVNKHTLTFLDTPGHEAFSAMRQRGANVTDIVILVVAADDGVMPQTKESIRFCEQAGVPIIVAINKMDKEGANPDRIKQELTEFNLTAEDWGGQTMFVPISALKGEGIDDLLENIALQAEMMELRANDNGVVEGVVIESHIEQGRGPMATVLIQTGTLRKGESIVIGEAYGRARGLMDHTGKVIKTAGPSSPVLILGLNKNPNPGDILNIVKSEREAKKIAENRQEERKGCESAIPEKQVSLEDFFATAAGDATEKKTLKLIIRCDVQGSYEAIRQSIEPLSNKEVEVKVIGGGVGPISESDVTLAETSLAVVIGFNMRPMTKARRQAEEKGVDIKNYSVIYDLINDVKLALEGLLAPEYKEEFIGRAEVKELFTVPKIGVIAGSEVIDGKIKTGCNIRLLRNGQIIFDGQMSSLKRFKEDAKEVKNGMECGIGLKDYNDLKVGDLFEAYMLTAVKRTLEEVEKQEMQQEIKKKAAAAASEVDANPSI